MNKLLKHFIKLNSRITKLTEKEFIKFNKIYKKLLKKYTLDDLCHIVENGGN